MLPKDDPTQETQDTGMTQLAGWRAEASETSETGTTDITGWGAEERVLAEPDYVGTGRAHRDTTDQGWEGGAWSPTPPPADPARPSGDVAVPALRSQATPRPAPQVEQAPVPAAASTDRTMLLAAAAGSGTVLLIGGALWALGVV